MSRLGKVPLVLPKEIKATVQASSVLLEGPKGKMTLDIPYGIKVELNDGVLTVTRGSDTKQNRANHGTVRAHLKNMVTGLIKGHKKELEIQGVGFRAQLQGKKISFTLGFSHPVEFEIPQGITAQVPSQTSIIIEGVDRGLVGRIASEIRAIKPPEPYKGKGIRYINEKVRRKQGKSVTK